MKSRHDLTLKEREKIIRLFLAGVSGPALAERFGCDRSLPPKLVRAMKGKDEENDNL